MPKYEIWYSEQECSYSMFPEDHPQRELLIEEDAVLEKVLEAANWEDAQHQKHEYLGWEPYMPME